MRYLVDGMNVIGSRADGWWRDRAGARKALVERLQWFAPGNQLTVVFDGRPGPGEVDGTDQGGVLVRFAPGGRDAADDRIVSIVGDDAAPASVVVVTSDSALVERVKGLGAQVESAGRFRRRLEEVRRGR